MLVPFKSLPKDSRIWIFPSSEEIDIQKKAKIKERLIKFISDWTSHNKNLQASFELPYNRFIVVALNENLQNASGCSIDSLMNLIQILEKDFDFANFTKSFRVKYTISLLLSLYKTFILSNKIKSNSFSKICTRFINESIEHPEAF